MATAFTGRPPHRGTAEATASRRPPIPRILETFEPVDDLVDFYQSADYRHRVAGVHFDTLFGVGRPLQRVLDPWINARIEAMRSAERRRRPGRTGLVPIQKSQGDDAGL